MCSLAALCLHDGDVEITADNILTLVTASGNTTAPYWPALFAPFLQANIQSIINSGGAGAVAAPAASAAAPAAGGEKKEEKKEKAKVEEVDALDGGMDMFGGSGGAKDY